MTKTNKKTLLWLAIIAGGAFVIIGATVGSIARKMQ